MKSIHESEGVALLLLSLCALGLVLAVVWVLVPVAMDVLP